MDIVVGCLVFTTLLHRRWYSCEQFFERKNPYREEQVVSYNQLDLLLIPRGGTRTNTHAFLDAMGSRNSSLTARETIRWRVFFTELSGYNPSVVWADRAFRSLIVPTLRSVVKCQPKCRTFRGVLFLLKLRRKT